MRVRMLHVGVTLLGGALLGAIAGRGHNPNQDINMEEARAAASRVHPPPRPGVKMMQGAGG